jgi:ABC-2 type transport system ATP-binding protein
VALFRSLTVRENLDVFVQLAGRPKDRVHTDAVLRASRLTEVANTLVAHLSGGLQRRANIAVALSLGAKALLLDEPTTGIDLEARARIHELLRELRDAGTAILLVTHDFEQAERLADRVGFMIHGRIVREGRPTEILQQAFGRKIQVEAILMDPPERAGAAILEALGLSPFEGRRIWRGLADPGPSLPEAFEQLRAGPVSIHEVRVRSPGLDMLFHRLIADASRSNETRVPSAEEIAMGDVP